MKDSAFLVLSVLLAIAIAELDLVEKFLTISGNIRIIGSFVAGLFFTSAFTTSPAIVLLGEISQIEPIFIVALVGAVGAVCGDLLIFSLFKNHVANDLNNILRLKKIHSRGLFHKSIFRWLSVLIGGLIIASPLPDELGIAIMGCSKLKLKVFIPVSFAGNFVGITLIGYASRLLN